MKKIVVKIIKTNLVLLCWSEVVLAECVNWNQENNKITNINGELIGIADVTQDNRAEDLRGNPLSDFGETCISGSVDNRKYSTDNLSINENFQVKNEVCDGISGCKSVDSNILASRSGETDRANTVSSAKTGQKAGEEGSGGDTTQALSASEVPDKIKDYQPGQYAMIATTGEILDGTGNGPHPRQIILAELKSSSALTKLGTGVLIDPRELKKAPLQSGFGEGNDKERPSLSKVYGYEKWNKLPDPMNVGVDDEVMKTSMAMYQPLHRMQLDYLNDKTARNRYIDQGLTVRGVTVLAFGFLDRTLGSGLTDIQQQADNNTTQQILKQVNWSLERLASPDRAETFKDVDEKLEACLEESLKREVAKTDVKSEIRKRVDFKCSKTCGDVPVAEGEKKYRNPDFSDQSKHGNGSYAYCVCCAETAAELNYLTEDKKEGPLDGFAGSKIEGGEDLKKSWSLVERSFLGVKRPQGNGGKVGELREFVMLFTKLFGDYVLRKDPRSTEDDAIFAYQYQSPQISVQKLVALHKNRCYDSGSLVPKSDLKGGSGAGTGGFSCGIEEEQVFAIKYGVCPSLMAILMNWSESLNGTKLDDLEQKLAEASMGMPLYGAIIEGLLAMVSNTSKEIQPGQESLKVASAIEAFCNASATAAVSRHMSFYKNLTNDALMYNTVVTQREKVVLHQLIDKYVEAIRLADLDEQSKYRVYGIAQGISMNRDRGTLQSLASSSQAQSNLIANTTNRTSLSSFVSSGMIEGNGGGALGGGGGGGRPVVRTRSDFSTQLTGKAAELMRESETAALKLDPLKNGVLGSYARSIGKSLE